MDEGKRPGGLTALAVINFILAGSRVLSFTGMAMFFTPGLIPTDKMDETQRAQIEAMQNMGTPVIGLLLALTLLSGVLLLLSGIGYLQQKRVLGRMVGNIYAIMAIVATVVSIVQFASFPGGGFSIMTIVGFIYPVLTLILINTTFKDDLTN